MKALPWEPQKDHEAFRVEGSWSLICTVVGGTLFMFETPRRMHCD